MEHFNRYHTAVNRTQPVTVAGRYDTKNPQEYIAVVTTSGILETITRSVIVFIPSLKIYSEAVRADCPDLSVNCVGKSYPLVFGDRVVVRFLNGNVNACEIVARDPSPIGLKGFVMQTDHPIPQPGDEYQGYLLNPPPVCIEPEALIYANQVTIEVSRYIGESAAATSKSNISEEIAA